MSLFVLDTDTMTLWLRGHMRVCERISVQDPSRLCTTIVTIEELLRGWYTQIRKAKGDEQVARAYAALQQTVQVAARLHVLAFDQVVIRRFNDLRARKLRVGTNDLKIAATVLENEGLLVTRNQ